MIETKLVLGGLEAVLDRPATAFHRYQRCLHNTALGFVRLLEKVYDNSALLDLVKPERAWYTLLCTPRKMRNASRANLRDTDRGG